MLARNGIMHTMTTSHVHVVEDDMDMCHFYDTGHIVFYTECLRDMAVVGTVRPVRTPTLSIRFGRLGKRTSSHLQQLPL